MARIDHLTGGIYRISTYAPEKRISFNQFLIDDNNPALIHTGTFPDPTLHLRRPALWPAASRRGRASEVERAVGGSATKSE